MQHVSIPLSRAISDLLVRAGAPADRANPIPGVPPVTETTSGCSLCGSLNHTRTNCPWGAGLQTTRRGAIEKGQSRYFTGRPCVAGHIALRFTVLGDCAVCRNLRQNERRKRQREQLRKAWR